MSLFSLRVDLNFSDCARTVQSDWLGIKFNATSMEGSCAARWTLRAVIATIPHCSEICKRKEKPARHMPRTVPQRQKLLWHAGSQLTSTSEIRSVKTTADLWHLPSGEVPSAADGIRDKVSLFCINYVWIGVFRWFSGF